MCRNKFPFFWVLRYFFIFRPYCYSICLFYIILKDVWYLYYIYLFKNRSIPEKAKLEEKQKNAINVLYDLFPERYENWQKRIKMRRIFNEESAHKSQFYAVWALNNFSLLMTRINQSSPQNRMNYLHRLGTSSHLDAQQFLLDR